LPDYNKITELFDQIKNYIKKNNTRLSCHPSEYCVLASRNEEAVDKTIKELNFYSWFMDQIGCPANYSSPMNLHINNNDGEPEEIIDRLVKSFDRLDENCKNRIVIENDDKINCWSVGKLLEYYHSATNKPVTFDYLHHKCHPDNLNEKDAVLACHETWKEHKPLFHYSESREGRNPRAHADYPSAKFDRYDLDFDIDFEFKMKCRSIKKFQELFPDFLI
jgi:UV DNA damage endonuclease